MENFIQKQGPREKLEKVDIQTLTDKELLMLLIGSGNSKRSVEEIALDTLNKLDLNPNLTYKDLKLIYGLGEAKASLLAAALEIGRRRGNNKDRVITSPEDVFREIQHYSSREQEHFVVMMLNGASEVLGTFVSTIGLLDRSLVHPREVFSKPIKHHAFAIIIAHNHPSGHLEPSEDDINVTERLTQTGQILGIRILDHLIFDERHFYSFKENGLM